MALRSLSAGVSGLLNAQLGIDVIGSNLANGGTEGYKSSRVTSKDSFSQTLAVAAAPTGGLGGTNPKQVGLGVTNGSIDINMNQGNLISTGRSFDLAIQGTGFFKVSDGSTNFYTRNGAMGLDANGSLVNLASGLKVQGKTFTNGVLGNTVGDITIATGTIQEPQETSSFEMAGNLDAGASQVGTILTAESLLGLETTAQSADMGSVDFTLLDNSSNTSTLPTLDSTTVVTVVEDGAGTTTLTFGASNDFTTFAELVADIDTALGGAHTAAIVAGELSITASGADLDNVTITVAGTGATELQTALGFGTATNITDGNTSAPGSTFFHEAQSTDLLVNLRNSATTTLGIADGNTVSINGKVNGTAVTAGSQSVTGATTTFGDLATTLDTTLGIDNSTGVAITDGALKITGDGGTTYALSEIDLQISGNTTFNGIFADQSGNYTSSQTAQDNFQNSIVVFDEQGFAHTMTFKFNIREASASASTWVWDATSVKDADSSADSFTGGSNTGTITFGSDGSISSFTPTSITMDPSGPAGAMAITVDPGTTGAFDGLVSFERSSDALIRNQNGFAAGALQEITFDSNGVVAGIFDNGNTQNLAKITLAKFDNEAGLLREGDSLFRETVNSGTGVDNDANVGGRGGFVTSSLEASNVDTPTEFTNLIIFQRLFQSNARIITVSDSILAEITGLKR